MSVIDRVKSHFESIENIVIEVEQWKDENGNPSVFYCEPITLEEKTKLQLKSSGSNDSSILADLLVMKLLVKNEKGDLVKAFQPEDKFALKKKADVQVIGFIASKILEGTFYEDAEKK